MSVNAGEVVGVLDLEYLWGKKLDRANKDTTKFTNKTKKNFSSVNRAAKNLFAGFTAAAVVSGLSAASAAAVDYNESLLQMETLVGVQRTQAQQWKGDLLDLAGTVGVVPQQLAEGMFFVTSAGLRGSEALDTLEASAQASALGLGNVIGVVDAATSAVNAYGFENLSAADATNVLFETVREGKTSADQLAPSLGKVIGLASQMQVEFGEVGGFVAAYTRTSGDAADATTALNALFTSFLSDSPDVIAAYDDLGFSIEDVRASIANDGLADTLVELTRRVRQQATSDVEAAAALRKIIPEARAVKGILAVTGEQSETYVGISDRVSDSVNEQADAWKTLQERSDKLKLDNAIAQLEGVKIRVGGAVTPILIAGAGALDTYTKAIEDLYGALKDLLDDPLSIFLSDIQDLFRFNIVGLSETWGQFGNAMDDVPWEETGEGADYLAQAIANMEAPIAEVTTKAKQLSISYADIKKAQLAKELNDQAKAWHELLGEASPGINVLRDIAEQQYNAAAAAEAHQLALDNLLEKVSASLRRAAKLRDELADRAAGFIDSLEELPAVNDGSFFGIDMAGVIAEAEARQKEWTEESKATAEAQKQGALQAQAWGDYIANAGFALADFGAQLFDIESSAGRLINAFASIGQLIGDAVAGSRSWGDAISQAVGVLGSSGVLGSTGSSIAQGAATGAQIGGIYGAIIGAFVGWAADAMDKTEQAFADGATHAQGIIANDAFGEYYEEVDSITQTIQNEFNGILELFGAQVANFNTFGVLLREGSQGISVAINDDWTNFGDDIQGAIDHAVTMLVRQADFIGLSPEAEAALERFAGNTLEELRSYVSRLFEVENLHIPQATQQLTAEFDRYMALLREFPTHAGNILNAATGTFQSEYNALFNIQEDARAIRLAEIEALKAATLVKISELEVIHAGATVALEAAKARAEGVKTEAQLVETLAQVGEGYAKVMGGVAQATGIAAQFMGLSVEQLASLVAATAAALEALEKLDFSDDAIQRALNSIPSIGSVAVSTAADYTDSLQSMILQLQAGDDPLAQFKLRMMGIDEQIAQSNLTLEEEQRLRGLLHQQFLDQQQQREQARLDEIATIHNEWQATLNASVAGGEWVNKINDIITAHQAEVDRLLELEDTTYDAADAAAVLEAQLQTVVDSALNELNGSLGFLQGAIDLIPNPAARIALQEKIAEAQAQFWLLEFLSREAAIRGMLLQLEAQGLLTKELEELGDDVLELFDGVGDHLDDIVDAMGDVADQLDNVTVGGVGGSGVLGVGDVPFPDLLPSAIAGGIPNIFALLEQLAQLQGQSQGLSQAEILLGLFEQYAPFLEAFGVNLEDVTAQLEDLIDASGGAAASLQDLLFGGSDLSGASARLQYEAQLPGILSLFAAANAGDASAEAELAQVLPSFLQLAQSALLGEYASFFANLQQLGAGFLPGPNTTNDSQDGGNLGSFGVLPFQSPVAIPGLNINQSNNQSPVIERLERIETAILGLHRDHNRVGDKLIEAQEDVPLRIGKLAESIELTHRTS